MHSRFSRYIVVAIFFLYGNGFFPAGSTILFAQDIPTQGAEITETITPEETMYKNDIPDQPTEENTINENTIPELSPPNEYTENKEKVIGSGNENQIVEKNEETPHEEVRGTGSVSTGTQKNVGSGTQEDVITAPITDTGAQQIEPESLSGVNTVVQSGSSIPNNDAIAAIQIHTVYEDTTAGIETTRTESKTILTKSNITVILPSDVTIHTAKGSSRSLEELTIMSESEIQNIGDKKEKKDKVKDKVKNVIEESNLGIVEVDMPSLVIEEQPSSPEASTNTPDATTLYEDTGENEAIPDESTGIETLPEQEVNEETIPDLPPEIILEDITLEKSSDDGPKPLLQEIFEFGIPGEHLIFSEPIMIEYTVPFTFSEGTLLEISVLHAGDAFPGVQGLATDSSTSCLPDGASTKSGFLAKVLGGKVTFFTCGASIFTVTYTGGATFDNFVDNSSTGKVISVTSGDIAPGSTIQDVKVIVDFRKIDGENPATPGAGQAYSPEASFVLQSPLGTIVSLLPTNTYTNNANADRVTVTFDDTADDPPTGLPTTGSFLPYESLSNFDYENPLGDWFFTFADNANQDGLTLYSVSLEINAAENCGNGTLNIGEGCDDGNTSNGDGCNSACNIENNYTCNSSSPGFTGDASCNSNLCNSVKNKCQAANTCGNNKLEIGEQCDDGDTVNGDGCSSSCTIEFCGNGVINTITGNITLFLEDFESMGNGTVTTNSTLVSTTGYTLTYQNDNPTGRGRYGTTAVQKNGGAGAITLDVNPSGTFVKSYLIFQVDLTRAVSATDLALAFDFSHHGEESHITDRVWIRGSSSDLRLEIYDRDANKGAAGTYTAVTNLDIDSTLTSNGQYPSSTFQVRFGQEDNFPATSTTASDGLSVDNVNITGTPINPTTSEQCDDGNTVNNDGCNQSCNIQSGWTCTGEPSFCTEIPAPSGLRLHYDGSMTGGLFKDISGSGFDGTQFNGVTTGNQNGETIMCFNGTTQYIERATNLVTAYPFTMSTWMKSDTTTGLRGMMSFARSTSANRMWNLEHNGTTLRQNAQNTTATYTNATSTLNTTEWFLVTAVYTSNTSRNIYINGILQGTNTTSVTYNSNANNRLNIGRFADSSHGNFFDGCLDDIRFYSTALTSGQIYTLYAKPAALTTSATTSTSPVLTGTIQGTLDTITLTISGNMYTGINNGNGTWTLSGGVISPGLANGSYTTILTVTNPYGRAVTYTSSFTVTLPIGDFCITGPSTITFPSFTTRNVLQTGTALSSGYFQLIDTSGVNSGYYTTLQITALSGTTTILANTGISRLSTGVVLLSGTVNTGVVLGSAFSGYSVASGTVTFIKRDPAPNGGKQGTYGAPLQLRITIPAYLRPDTYTGTITYTLYEN